MEEKQYLMLPGPTTVPPNVLRGMAKPMINHRGPEFKELFTGQIGRASCRERG